MKTKAIALGLLCCTSVAILARPNVPPQPIIHFSDVAMKGLIRETLDEWWEDVLNQPIETNFGAMAVDWQKLEGFIDDLVEPNDFGDPNEWKD